MADGNFFPAGDGGFADAAGFFDLAGTTDRAGQPLWLFAFEDGTTFSFFQVLATSQSADWTIPAGATDTLAIDALDADAFVLGMDHPLGVRTFVVPFPEPAAGLPLAAAASCLLARRRAAR